MNYPALALASVVMLATAASAQNLVDPSKVAPEHRQAAALRRAEQIKARDCAKKAEAEKVLPRDKTAFIVRCVDAADKH